MRIKKSLFHTALFLAGLLSSQAALLTVPERSPAFEPPASAEIITPAIFAPEILGPRPLSAQPIAAAITAQANLQAVVNVSIPVSDMAEALAFYTKVLPFEKISDVEVFGTDYERLQGLFGIRMRVVQLRLGSETIELIDYLTPGGRPIPVDSKSNDRWFQHIAIVLNDMAQAYQHLRQHNVQHASTGPQRLPDYIPAAAGIEAFYFQDPDGHNLEIIFFPPGKGDPRWQQPTTQRFLGIDHTAIAIANTQASQQFYENLLGLKLAGQSENYGTEQEHLNNVFGARLLISGLTPPTGPAIEFLEYLAPAGGRPMPADTKADDLWHWQTTISVKDINLAAKRLRQGGAQFISPGVVTLPTSKLGFKAGFLVKDPDGHVLRIIQR
ncbi:VOC family protein [filamentous cyanobacterium LEGE 11480]|uniref:VOC family protein n=1 Tax=Romeriopsis navalis LEGE 11480 TaxID=2777977 RepID=A0A928VHH9_9CYAN|nr:VOC family protein [Romeriopsis navalis]MBE9028716.1 VOC family protein [Romeriopsis navalis LEGE 11480]